MYKERKDKMGIIQKNVFLDRRQNRMTNTISQHTFNAYANRTNQPKVFFGANDARTTEYTGIDWGKENAELKNRRRRINLEN